MARSFDPKKLALWQGRFQRFLDSGLAVARFCAVEEVSESSFYYWQKKLGPQTRRRSARAEDRSVRTVDRGIYAEHHGTRVEDHATCAEDRDTYAEDHDTRTKDHDASVEDHGVFRPVTVMPSMCGVVIRLPGGTRIEVDANHLDAIRAVVAETVRVDHGQVAERNASSGNGVNRNVSSGNQVMRKRSGTVSC